MGLVVLCSNLLSLKERTPDWHFLKIAVLRFGDNNLKDELSDALRPSATPGCTSFGLQCECP